MAQDQNQTTARNDGDKQVEVSNMTNGEAWVKAVAESAIPERLWTLSRIDSSLGSIA